MSGTYLHDLETDTGNVTLGVAGATETSDKNLVVLIDEVKATVVGHEGSDLLTVLDELHTHALTHSGVGLLRLDTDLLKNDPLGVGAAGERLGPLLAQVATLVALVRPVVDAALGTQLATGAKSVGLTCTTCNGSALPPEPTTTTQYSPAILRIPHLSCCPVKADPILAFQVCVRPGPIHPPLSLSFEIPRSLVTSAAPTKKACRAWHFP